MTRVYLPRNCHHYFYEWEGAVMPFVEINDDPSVLALYDEVNGVVHLMSDALGSRTQGVNSLEEAKARYSDYVTESKTTEELGSDDE